MTAESSTGSVVALSPAVRRLLVCAWACTVVSAVGFVSHASVLDSVTPAPGAMGPNALPVPYLSYPSVDSVFAITIAADGYYDPRGDRTVNPYLHMALSLRRIAEFILFTRPVEYFTTTDAVRSARHARDTQGTSPGDLYFQTMIQILREERMAVDLAMNVTLKTTTGKNLENARHINAPAYFFDLTAGKTLLRGRGFVRHVRAAAVASFIAWQTDVNQQNDALGYGALVSADLGRAWTAWLEGAGYAGWQHNGDRPEVLRIGCSVRLTKWLGIAGLFQYGVRDQPPYAVKIGTCLRFPSVCDSPK